VTLVAGAHDVAGGQFLPGPRGVEVGGVVGVDVNRGRDHLQRGRRGHRGLGLDDKEVVAAAEDQEDDQDDRGRASSPRARTTGRRRGFDHRDQAPRAQQQHEDQHGEREGRRDELDRQDIQPSRRLRQEEPGGGCHRAG